MGADVAQHSPAAQHVFTIADQALGWSLSELCFQGTAETLTATQNTQPALVATSLAVLAALAGDVTQIAAFTKAHAVAVAGHSLGEYSALAAAGSLTVADAVTLVRRRGELMAAASAGGMAAVIGLDDDTIDAICQQASTPEASRANCHQWRNERHRHGQ
jgi:[acyl-carrier-protein] S-malonyltransferase